MTYLRSTKLTKSEKVLSSKSTKREVETTIYEASMKILAVALAKGAK